ncbi:hypothetical protein JTB14_028225 [Gonioctena quinquepunctata]|nr:hypothetical protein JTB14_028225 [Gonioctena quinquepunctata]
MKYIGINCSCCVLVIINKIINATDLANVPEIIEEGGKPITRTLVFQSPITEEELENIWDEQTLRLLLEQSTDYEERRNIRSRLRKIMAEQEACTELVEKASQEQSGRVLEGESLLLPLLQGLLKSPEQEQTADSGIDSGEDQRSGLIAEVQSALEKLASSLCNDSTDIAPERRDSLLQLVTRLQAGLSPTSPKLERRLSSGPGRYNRRKNRQNRHTVGVSSEELADARRLIEEISTHEITPSPSANQVPLLQKQNSESSVTSNSSVAKLGNKVVVRNATAKPFSNSSNSVSNVSSAIQTPTDPTEHLEPIFGNENILCDIPPCHEGLRGDSQQPQSKFHLEKGEINPRISSPVVTANKHVERVHEAVKQAASRKKRQSESIESETEDTITVNAISSISYQKEEIPSMLKVNPTYVDFEKTSDLPVSSHEEKVSRFNTHNKKLKMKRANTIDIPKALKFYEDENDSDTSDDEDGMKQRRNNYYALRGPIRLGNSTKKNIVPILEPKTESDQKFLAFINKNNQNSDSDSKVSLWTGRNDKTTVWSNKFGNIKNNFEKASVKTPNNSARSFWKTQDDSSALGGISQYGPKISKQSARNLQQMFEEKKRQSQERRPFEDEANVVTGSLTVKIEPDKNTRILPQQPVPMNKFSHAPQSAFRPIPKKNPTNPKPADILGEKEIMKTEYSENTNNGSFFLYSPKPLVEPRNCSMTTSPVNPKPWAINASEHGGRVLSMAAKKFETPSQPENFSVKPRKLSKEFNKVFLPQQTPKENLSAPFLVSNASHRNSSVRKLSDQYDSMGSNIPDLCSHLSPKFHSTLENRSLSVLPHDTPPEMNLKKSSPTYYAHKYDPHHYQSKSTNVVDENLQSSNDTQPSFLRKEQNTQANIYNKSESESEPIYQLVPGRDERAQTPEKFYTSSLHLNEVIKPEIQIAPVQKIEPEIRPPKLQSQLSTESLHEHNAISSRVMSGPVCQNAVTIRQKSPMSREQHDMNAAFNLKNVLQKVSRGDPSPPKSPTGTKNELNQYKASISTKTIAPSNISATNTPGPEKVNHYDTFKSSFSDERNGFNRSNIRSISKPMESHSFKYKLPENSSRAGNIFPQNENKTFGVVRPIQQKPVSATPIYNNVNRIQISRPLETPIEREPKKFHLHRTIIRPLVLSIEKIGFLEPNLHI